jgi:hypothetical protein
MFYFYRQYNCFFFVFLFTVMIYSQTTISSDDPSIQYFGRIDRSTSNCALFDWPGVYIRALFEGTSCRAVIEGHSCFDVIVDGKQITTIRTNTVKNSYILAQDLTDRNHKLLLAKRCETTEGPVSFFGFIIDKGKRLGQLPNPPLRKIEFIGDSYTVGYANEYLGVECVSGKADSIICATTNTNKSFGPLVAQAFDAQYHIIAISGKGLVRNYNGADPGKELPFYYDKTLISANSGHDKISKWNFLSWKADVAIITIGINDFQGEPPYADSSLFDATYISLLERLRKQYAGVSLICCATKVWPHNTLIPRIRHIVGYQQEENHRDVYYFEFASGNSALYGHPAVRDHRAIADSLIPVVAHATGWKRTDLMRGK